MHGSRLRGIRVNWTALLLAGIAGMIVMLVQYFVRPMFPAGHAARLGLNLAPNLFTGFGCPFLVVIPTLFPQRVTNRLFYAAAALTFLVLLQFELRPLLQGRSLDLADVAATIAGVGAACAVYRKMRR